MEKLILFGILVIITSLIVVVVLEWRKKKDNYTPPVTLSLDDWRNYVANGYNTLLGSGGVIPGGTESVPFGSNGAVYKGHVRQGIGM